MKRLLMLALAVLAGAWWVRRTVRVEVRRIGVEEAVSTLDEWREYFETIDPDWDLYQMDVSTAMNDDDDLA